MLPVLTVRTFTVRAAPAKRNARQSLIASQNKGLIKSSVYVIVLNNEAAPIETPDFQIEGSL